MSREQNAASDGTFNPRSLAYLLIPAGFVLIVSMLVISGVERQADANARGTSTVPVQAPQEG